MRWGLIVCFLFFAYFVFVKTALAATTPENSGSGKSTCRVETGDIGTIIGRGPSSEAAFEDAATQCFDRRNQLYKAKHGGQKADMETGELYIDVCANIKCG